MDVLVNTQAFVRELRRAEKITTSKGNPIYENVLLQAESDTLRLSATDRELGFTTGCAANVQVPGSATLPAKRLLSLIAAMANSDVQLIRSEDAPHVTLVSGSFRSQLQTQPVENFPSLPVPTPTLASLPGDEFRKVIRKVRIAIAEKDQRTSLNGALLRIDPDQERVALVGTDAQRLSIALLHVPVLTVAVQTIIPVKALDALLQDTGGDLSFAMSPNHLFFGGDGWVLNSTRLDGAFPNYEAIIPRTNNSVLHVAREVLLAALNRVVLIAGDSPVTLTVSAERFTISSARADVGNAVETVPVVTYSGDPLKIAVKGGQLADFLTNAANDITTIRLKDTRTAILVEDGNDYLGVFLLVR